jgi:hypothetical protein
VPGSGTDAGAASAEAGTDASVDAATNKVGPRVPVGPQPLAQCPAGSIAVTPSTIQAMYAAQSSGASYCLGTGTYAQLQISPRSGDSFIGLTGAILDGQNAVAHAFTSSASNVAIENLVIQNYTAPSQDAPINNRNGNSSGWVVKNNEVAHNAGAGLELQNATQMVANYVHDNRQEGYACGGTGMVITDNEIASNNPDDAVDPGWEAGAGKCWATIGLLLQHNYVHDNHGPGPWTDTDNQGIDVEWNDVENNWAGGIFHEISWDGVIANNLVKSNANPKYCTGWLWCSEIQIAASGGTNGKTLEVFGNTVVTNGAKQGNGIGLIQQNRGTGLYGTRLVQNVHVHDNDVDLSAGGAVGGVTDDGDEGLFSTQSNNWDDNHYKGASGSDFWWANGSGDFAFWQGQGNDTSGTSN